jgi:hypothetical protein
MECFLFDKEHEAFHFVYSLFAVLLIIIQPAVQVSIWR